MRVVLGVRAGGLCIGWQRTLAGAARTFHAAARHVELAHPGRRSGRDRGGPNRGFVHRGTGKRRPKLMERGHAEFLVYHPNAAADDKASRVDEAKTARMRIDLKNAPGTFQIEWFRPYDGVAQKAGTVDGGIEREFVAPWKGGMSCYACSLRVTNE